MKSNSSIGGQGSNEIRFEDKKGQEDIYVHAQRTLNTVVEASESRAVGGSRSTVIYHGETHLVKDDGRRTEIEKGGEWLTVKDGGRFTVIEKEGDGLVVQDGSRVTTVSTGDDQLEVKTGDRIRKVQKDDILDVKAGQAMRRVLNNDYTVIAKNMYLHGLEKILLKVGNSSITITPDQITLNSQAVLIDGGKSVKINADGIDLN